MRHEKTGFFYSPFNCPACSRAGRTTLIQDILVWRVHINTVHGEGARFNHLLTPKRKLDEISEQKQTERAMRKRQRIELPANGLIPGSALQPMVGTCPPTLWSSHREALAGIKSTTPPDGVPSWS